MKNYKLFPKITLWALLGLGVMFIIMFFRGGNSGTHEVAGDILSIPRFTDPYLIWAYILVALATVAAIVSVVMLLVQVFKKDKKKGFMVLAILFAYLYLIPQICWALASPAEVNIIGYEGSDNAGTMARLSDAMLYWTYFAVWSTFVVLVWAIIKIIISHNKK